LLAIPELPKTIDDIFDQLDREVTADGFEAEFNEELGYPTHVLVDRMSDAVDDELEFFVTDFTATSAARDVRDPTASMTTAADHPSGRRSVR
jgi:Family of unknown function (DUF6174)